MPNLGSTTRPASARGAASGHPVQDRPVGGRLARDLHPGAWWLWALGMATAASRTTNPLLLGLIIAVVALVVSARRSDAPWARGFGAYLVLGLMVVAVRVLFRMLLDAQYGTTVLFTLPEIPLPEAAAGIRLGGPVSAEGLLSALYDGLRLATLIICLGAANVLANPKRLLAAVPSALYEVGAAVTVALSVAPQLVESGRRVLRARRLRGDAGRRTRWFRQIAMPVMTDALDRSLLLAAAMDSRGYGRSAHVPVARRRVTATLVLAGMAGICVGTYGLLDRTTPRALGLPMLAVGLALASVGFATSRGRVQRTRYRPDQWRAAEWGVTACGVTVAAVLGVAGAADPVALEASVTPLGWPPLPLLATAGILVGALPAVIAPPPRRSEPAAPASAVGPSPESLRPQRDGGGTPAGSTIGAVR
jgi:energy-coupling factor transport system permease protein